MVIHSSAQIVERVGFPVVVTRFCINSPCGFCRSLKMRVVAEAVISPALREFSACNQQPRAKLLTFLGSLHGCGELALEIRLAPRGIFLRKVDARIVRRGRR